MKHIEKNEEPVEFTAWKVQEAESLESCYELEKGAAACAWNLLPSNEPKIPEVGVTYFTKKKLKDALLEEQGSICAFCMAGLKNDADCTIDHLQPKAEDARNRTFDYQNLLACCSGIVTEDSALNYKEDLRHCNNKKEDKTIPITPLMVDCESKFLFTIDGEILPVLEDDAQTKITIDRLGLNSKILEKRRKDTIYHYLYPDVPTDDNPNTPRLITKEEAKTKIAQLTQKSNGRFSPFVMAVIQVLESI